MQILFASTNKGKIQEAQRAAAALPILIISPQELIAAKGGAVPEVAETGHTYEENATLKADAFFAWSGLPSLADDSGLEVRALHGAPGLYSARYAGEGATRAQNTAKLLAALVGVRDRSAMFVCCLALKFASGDTVVVRGTLEGEIADREIGTAGFGYDNVFLVRGTGKTLAQLKEGSGVPRTHRTSALEKLVLELKRRV